MHGAGLGRRLLASHLRLPSRRSPGDGENSSATAPLTHSDLEAPCACIAAPPSSPRPRSCCPRPRVRRDVVRPRARLGGDRRRRRRGRRPGGAAVAGRPADRGGAHDDAPRRRPRHALDAVRSAVTLAGLSVQQRWPLVNTVVAVGPAAAVATLAGRAGILRVDGDRPMAPTLATSHKATRSDLAAAAPATAGSTGGGISVAVVDSGINGTHRSSSGAAAARSWRTSRTSPASSCCPASASSRCRPTTPTRSRAAATARTWRASRPASGSPARTNPSGAELRGSAPSAKLVGLSVGAAIGLLDAAAAQNWVLEHQRRPCAPADQQDGPIDAACPPIRVTNHSYGPVASEGEDQQFDEAAVTVPAPARARGQGRHGRLGSRRRRRRRQLRRHRPRRHGPDARRRDGRRYDDGQTGNPDNQLSSFSSRGKQGTTGSYPDVSAPGDRIASACRTTLAISQGAPSYDGGDYRTISGTSMASPYVAGVAAQIEFGARPGTTPAQVEDLLEDTAHRSPRAARTSPTRSTRPRPRRSTRATASSTCSAPSTC